MLTIFLTKGKETGINSSQEKPCERISAGYLLVRIKNGYLIRYDQSPIMYL